MTKNELLEALTQAGVSRVEASYDGYGDEGCIDLVECYGPNEDEISISDELRDALDDVVFDLLCGKRQGWQNEEGSFGGVQIDVATGVAEVSHSWREPVEDDFKVSLREGG